MQNTLPRGYRGKQILYVHQPLPYQTWKKFSFFKPEEREYAVYQHLIGRMIDASVKRADKVIVQTQWMKDAVANKTGAAKDKIVKILPDISPGHGDGSSVFMQDSDSAPLPGIMKTEEPSPCLHNRFFYPAGEILYKNHECILKAAGLLKARGINDFEIAFTLNKGDVPGLDKYPDHEQVKYLGRIPREEVFKRYSSDILLFASYIETFGYPLAEARAVGGRIIASDCPFSHEILDGYGRAVFFDPFDPGKLAEIMEKSMSGDEFRQVQDKGDIIDRSESGWKRIIDIIINLAEDPN
jgi:glycosyltransferase involved in cell wall biosynthesis